MFRNHLTGSARLGTVPAIFLINLQASEQLVFAPFRIPVEVAFHLRILLKVCSRSNRGTGIHRFRATRMKKAARRRVQGIREVPEGRCWRQSLRRIGCHDRAQQRLSIGVERRSEGTDGFTEFHQASQIHHG